MEWFSPENIQWATDLVPTLVEYLQAVGAVVVSAKAITILTPTQIDDTILGGFGKVINLGLKALNMVALNVGKDKNADA